MFWFYRKNIPLTKLLILSTSKLPSLIQPLRGWWCGVTSFYCYSTPSGFQEKIFCGPNFLSSYLLILFFFGRQRKERYSRFWIGALSSWIDLSHHATGGLLEMTVFFCCWCVEVPARRIRRLAEKEGWVVEARCLPFAMSCIRANCHSDKASGFVPKIRYYALTSYLVPTPSLFLLPCSGECPFAHAIFPFIFFLFTFFFSSAFLLSFYFYLLSYSSLS